MMDRMPRITLFFVLFTSIVGAAAPAAPGQGPPPSPIAAPADALTASLEQATPVDPAVVLGGFDNGFRYFIREHREPADRAVLRLVVNVGSVLEDDDQLGLAHFLEHMAFNGSENFEKQELVRFMESIGMRLGPGVNASTSFDETIYMLELPTGDPAHLATAFQILEDWARGLTLDEEEIDLERGVVIEEWRLGQGAASRIRNQQLPVLFRDSRYAGRLPIGTRESLENFDSEALRRFYRDWYRPDLMAVVAVGDFDAATVEDLVRRHFAAIPAPADPREREVYGVPGHEGTVFVIAADPEITQTSIAVYQKLAAEDDWTIGGYRQRIVERLYNGMLNARFTEIAREPNPPFLRATSGNGKLIRAQAVYSLSAAVLEDGVERGLEALFREAERVARFGFTASELEREKTATMRSMERTYLNRANRSSGAFASEYTRAYLEGESIPGIEYEFELYRRFLPEITLEEVNRVGAGWTGGDDRVVLISGPEKEGLVLPDETALLAAIETARTAELAAYVDALSEEPLLTEPPAGAPVVSARERAEGVVEWELGNGVRVVLMPTDFDEDQIVFRGFSPGGASLAADEDYIPSITAASLIGASGVGPFSAVELEKALTGKVAQVAPFISSYEEGVSGAASPADLETMFQLIYLTFTAPRADETFFGTWLTQNRAALLNRNANPGVAFSDAYTRLITSDHPRSRPVTAERLEQADLAQSLAFYRDRFADAGDYTFIFVGDLEPDAMRPLVEQYLGGLPATGRQETWRDLEVRPPTGVFEETVRRGLEPRSQTRIAFTGPFDYADQAQRTGIRALAMTLEGRLRSRLREELGGTYSVGVLADVAWRPEGAYTLAIDFGSAPDRADELIQTVFEGVAAMKTAGPTENEVSDTREALLRSFETDFRDNRVWLSQLVSDYQRGVEPGASVRSYRASVEALTPASIQALAARYLNTENYVRVTLLPE